MKRTVLSKSYGAVYGKTEVRLDASVEDLAALRQALATVDKFKQEALKAAGAKEGPKGTADWTMVGYAVKTDCVIVTVEQGACG